MQTGCEWGLTHLILGVMVITSQTSFNARNVALATEDAGIRISRID